MTARRYVVSGVLVIMLTALAVALGASWTLGSAAALGNTHTVTKTEDALDGVCDADCSLREAIHGAASGDNVSIPSGTYTLSLGAQITISK